MLINNISNLEQMGFSENEARQIDGLGLGYVDEYNLTSVLLKYKTDLLLERYGANRLSRWAAKIKMLINRELSR